MSNFGQELHEKIYKFGITGSTDTGSGVKDIIVYALALDEQYNGNTDHTSNAKFDDATELFRIVDVDNRLCYTTNTAIADRATLKLRDENGYSITDTQSTGIPKHGANHVYEIEFKNYINGKYYAFWALAVDKAGNVETLNDYNDSSAVNTKYRPLLYTTSPLIDAIAPEFDTIKINDIKYDSNGYTYNSVDYYWYIENSNIASEINNKLLKWIYGASNSTAVRFIVSAIDFDDSVTQRTYFKYLNENNDSNIQHVDSVPGTSAILPDIKMNGAVGQIQLQLPVINSVNFSHYRIQRSVANVTSSTDLSPDNPDVASSWIGVVNTSDNKVIDIDLAFKTESFNSSNILNNTTFLYKITPISKYTDASGNPLEGSPIYSFYNSNIVNMTNYRPAAGESPNPPENVSATGIDGTIKLEWKKPQDNNNDIKLVRIYRTRFDDTKEVAGEVNILIAEVAPSVELYIDNDVEPYNPNLTEYSYKLIAVDYMNNSSTPAYSATTAASKKSIGHDGEFGFLSATGIIGGWKASIKYSIYEDIIKIKVIGKHSSSISSVDSAAQSVIGVYNVNPEDGNLTFTWMDAPPGTSHYAKFKFIAYDKWNNQFELNSFYPTLAVKSLTPQIVVDSFSPSILGYTVKPRIIIESDTIVTLESQDSSANTYNIKIERPTNNTNPLYVLRANSLAGKKIVDQSTGKVKTIASNTDFTVVNSTKITGTLTIVENITSDQFADGTNLLIEPTHIEVQVDKLPEVGIVDKNDLSNSSDDDNLYLKTDVAITDNSIVKGLKRFNNNDNSYSIYDYVDNNDPVPVFVNNDNYYDGWELELGQLTVDSNGNITGYTTIESYRIESYVNGEVKLADPISIDYQETYDSNHIAQKHYVFTFKHPKDLTGYYLYKSNIVAGNASNWILVGDSKDPFNGNNTFFLTDTNPIGGKYRYAISAYDLSGNESKIKANDPLDDITIQDTFAPGVPEVQGVVGGAGSLELVWNRPSSDVAYYKISTIITDDYNSLSSNYSDLVNNCTIPNPIPSELLYYKCDTNISSESLILYGLTLSKNNILGKDNNSGIFVKITAYDAAGNFLNTTFKHIDTAKIYLDDYIPSDGNPPNTPSLTPIVTTDGDGKAKIKLNLTSGGIDKTSIRVSIYGDYLDYNTGSVIRSDFLVGTYTLPPLDNDNNYTTNIEVTDVVNLHVKARYWITTIQIDGDESDPGPDSQLIEITDVTGPRITNKDIDAYHTIDTGKVVIKFKDVLDLNSASYEIWRTPDVKTIWAASIGSNSVSGNFYNATDFSTQPLPVNSVWERIITIPSTADNDTEHDFITYNDNDWQPGGWIDDSDTTLQIPYKGKAIYAIVPIDRWGNRGDVIFVPAEANSSSNSGTYLPDLCIVSMPYEPRPYNIPKGALYWNFNKSLQANRGDVPTNEPDVVLYPDKGLEVLGDLTYSLDKFNSDFSILLKQYEKVLQNNTIDLDNIVDLYIYDTKADTVDSSWRFNSNLSWYNEPFSSVRGFSKEFPEIALVVATNNDRLQSVFIIDYYSGKLWMRVDSVATSDSTAFWPNRDSGDELVRVFMINGRLFIANVNTGTLNYALGIREIDFSNDVLRGYRGTSGNWFGTWSGKIVNRSIIGSYEWDLVVLANLDTTDIIDFTYSIINNEYYIILSKDITPSTSSTYGIVVNRLSDGYMIKSTDTSKFIKVSIYNDYIFALKEDSNDIYRSTQKIQEMDWSTNGADVIEFEIVATDKINVGDKIIRFPGYSVQDSEYKDYHFYISDSDAKKQFELREGTVIIKAEFFKEVNDSQGLLINLGGTGYESGTRVYIANDSIKVEIGEGDSNIGSASYYLDTQGFSFNKNNNLAIRWHNDGLKTYVDFFDDFNLVKHYEFNGIIGTNPEITPIYLGGKDKTGVTGELNAKITSVSVFNYAISDNKIKDYLLGAAVHKEDKWGAIRYVSSFNSDTDNRTAIRSSMDYNQTINGTDGWLKITAIQQTDDSGNPINNNYYLQLAKANQNELVTGELLHCSFDIYTGPTIDGYKVFSWNSKKLFAISPFVRIGTEEFSHVEFDYIVRDGDIHISIDMLKQGDDNSFIADANGGDYFFIKNISVVKKGCIAEWKADNYDKQNGILHTTKWIENGDDSVNDDLAFIQSDESKKPLLIEAPAKYGLIDKNNYIKAYYLDGKDDYLSISEANNENLNMGQGSYSIEIIYTAKEVGNFDNNGNLAGKGGWNDSYTFGITNTNGKPLAFMSKSGTSDRVITQSVDVIENEKYHLLAIFDRENGQLKFYNNNKLFDTKDISSYSGDNFNNAYEFLIGKYSAWFTKARVFLVRTFNKALTDNEREYLYSTMQVPLHLLNANSKNALINGNFESGDLTGWSINNTPTTAEISTSEVYSGTYSYHIVSDAVREGIRQITSNKSLLGKEIVFYARVKVVSGEVLLDVRKSSDPRALGYATIIDNSNISTSQTGNWITLKFVFIASDYDLDFRIVSNTSNSEFYIDNAYVKTNGCVLQLEPDSIHSSMWKDKSGNSLNAIPYGAPKVIDNQPKTSDITSSDNKIAVSFKSDITDENNGNGGLIILED